MIMYNHKLYMYNHKLYSGIFFCASHVCIYKYNQIFRIWYKSMNRYRAFKMFAYCNLSIITTIKFLEHYLYKIIEHQPCGTCNL